MTRRTTIRLNLRYPWKAVIIGGLGLLGACLALVAWTHDEQSVTLHFAYRSVQTVEIEREATVRLKLGLLTGSDATADIMTDDIRELTLGDMAVEVQVYPFGLILRVWDDETGRPITTFNYNPASNLQNRFGGSGFTGLHYVYHPRSDAELQFWATVE